MACGPSGHSLILEAGLEPAISPLGGGGALSIRPHELLARGRRQLSADGTLRNVGATAHRPQTTDHAYRERGLSGFVGGLCGLWSVVCGLLPVVCKGVIYEAVGCV